MVTRRWTVALAASALAALSAGCKDDRETQVTVAITSETKVPDEITNLEVIVTDADGSVRSLETHYVDSQRFFPSTLAIIPQDSSSIGTPVQVDIRAVKETAEGSVDMVLRRSVVSFVEDRNLLLPMPLRMACFSWNTCGPTETCAGGECVPAKADEEALPEFDPTVVFPEEAGEECFDEAECLPTSKKVELDSAMDCTFPLDGPGDVNVSIEWKAAKDRVIALDAGDAQEGWVRESDTRGRLSRGVCDALVLESPVNEALGVYVSSACPAKRSNQPHCAGGGVGVKLEPPPMP